MTAYDFTTRAGTIAAIRAECALQGLMMPEQQAYVLATVQHETANKFKPVQESFWLSDPDTYLKIHHPEYYPYYGRGYVQITWENNYRKFEDIVKAKLVKEPDLALKPDIALTILVYGFVHGLFSGVALSHYINSKKVDYIGARHCINGKDKAYEIAQLVSQYLKS